MGLQLRQRRRRLEQPQQYSGATDPGLANEINFNPGNVNAGFWQTANNFPTNQDGDSYTSAYRYGAVSFTFVDPAVDAIATGSVPSNTALTVAAGAKFDTASTPQSVGSLSDYQGSGGTVALGGGTFTVGGDGTSTTFSGVITGAGLLVKTGVGTLTGAGPNTFTGAVTINQGSLALGAANTLPTGTISVSSNGNLSFAAITPPAFTIGGLAGNGSVTLTDTLANPVALSVGGNNTNTTFSGTFSGAGSLTKIGAGTSVLGNVPGYGGNTRIAAGTLDLNGNTFTLAASQRLILDGGLLADGTVSTATSFADLNSGTVSGVLSGGGSLFKSTTGTVILTNAGNNYGGGTTINAGMLQISGSGQLPSGSTVTLGGGTLSFNPLAPGLLARFYAGTNFANATGVAAPT